MKWTALRRALLGLALMSAATLYGCDTEPSRSDAHSTATGERDQRLGNDPSEQNTGRGSNAAEEVPPTEPAPRAAPGQPAR